MKCLSHKVVSRNVIEICVTILIYVRIQHKATLPFELILSVTKQVVGNFCMDLAIKKAKEYGIGCVVCKGN